MLGSLKFLHLLIETKLDWNLVIIDLLALTRFQFQCIIGGDSPGTFPWDFLCSTVSEANYCSDNISNGPVYEPLSAQISSACLDLYGNLHDQVHG